MKAQTEKLTSDQLKNMGLGLTEQQRNFLARQSAEIQKTAIALFQERQKIAQNGGMEALLMDKIDSTTYTGFSLTNFIAFLFYPTEQRLRDAMHVYQSLSDLRMPDIDMDVNRRSFNNTLLKNIEAYKESALVGGDDDKAEQLEKLKHILLIKTGQSTDDAACLIGEVRAHLDVLNSKQKKEYRDVIAIFSKICAVNPDLNVKSDIFDEALTTPDGTIQDYLLSCVQWFIGTIQALGRTTNQAFDVVAQAVGPSRTERIDTLIKQKRTELEEAEPKNAEEIERLKKQKNTLREIHASHEISKAFEGKTNWYNVYSHLYDDKFLITKKPASSTVGRFKSQLMGPSREKTFLEKFEESTPNTPQSGIHMVYKALSKIKLANTENQDLQREVKALEDQLRLIKFPDQGLLGENNTNIFELINSKVSALEKFPSLDSQKSALKELREALHTLKNAQSHPVTQKALKTMVDRFVQEHYKEDENMLVFPEAIAEQRTFLGYQF